MSQAAIGRAHPSALHEERIGAGGLHWQLRRQGHGPLVLLLHGTGASLHSWQGLAAELQHHCSLLSVDLPGHARSGPLPVRQRSLPGMAQALGELLQAVQARPHAVIGHSAGAAVMVQLALDGHLPGARLIGLNAALLPFEGWAGFLFPPLARLMALNPVVPWLAAWRAQDPAAVRRLIAATGSRLADDEVAHYAALLRQPSHVAGVLSMMASWDLNALQAALPRLQRPLHLLVATRDGTVPPAQAERLAARWPQGVHLHRLPGLGHLAHEEAPARVAAALVPLLVP
jgi:magnesium chelatase accessory protein